MNISTKRWQDADPAWHAEVEQHWERLKPLVRDVLAGPAPDEQESEWADVTAALLFALTLDALDRATLALQRAKKPKQQRHRARALRNITEGSAELGWRLGASLVAYVLREHPDGSPEQLLELVRARYLHLRDGACQRSEALA